MSALLKSVPTNNAQPTIAEQIETACAEWRTYKHHEELAKEARLRAEESLIELLSFSKLEGSATEKTPAHKITLTAKLDRKLDMDAYLAIEHQLPQDMRPVKTKVELDMKGVKWLEEKAPQYYAIVAPCITTKPAKTAVKVEFIGGV